MNTTAPPTQPVWITRQLHTLLQQRAHAWLIQGARGMGQWQLAHALAAAWLCEANAHNTSPQPIAPSPACGQCASCHMVVSKTHADLLVLMPETQLLAHDFPLDSKAQQDLAEKKRKPSKEIRIDAMRAAIHFAQHTSSRNMGKVVLIYPAERMNTITANALLKTLEEPAGNTKFILATEAAHQLLPTIRSRCIAHHMQLPSQVEALAWLRTQGQDEAAAKVLLAASGGNPQEAVDMTANDLQASAWQHLPQAAIRGEIAAFKDFTPAQTIVILQKLCHDLLCQKAQTSPRFFTSEALPKVAVGSWASLTAWSKQLRQTARTAEHPYNANLFTEHLLAQCAQACRRQAKTGV